MNNPLVSVVIVNYNGKKLLKTILNSLKKSSFKDYEIIVVDNASSDGSQQFVKKEHRHVKLVENKENLGYSGINSAIKHCNGKYIFFLNNDMIVEKDCIALLLQTAEKDKKIAMAAPALINYYDKTKKSGGTWLSRAFYNGHIDSKNKKKRTLEEIPYLGVGMVKKDFVDIFGYLFDKDYFIYAEDAELGLRIRLTGNKIIFNKDAVLYHMHAATSQKKNKAFNTYLMERNSLMNFFKMLSLKSIIIFAPYVFGMRVFAIIRDIFTLKISNALARIKALLWVLFNAPVICKKRKEIQKFRKANDSYILKVFSEKYLFGRKFIV
ncbi:glycosyltransferase family 2 protein [Candidatus Woesearchaeota archaeon]|nr:glycosyltransferase family 2 protein [Candidatus Woesearchaeota archaeon]